MLRRHLPLVFFIFSVAVAAFAYGYAVHRYNIRPAWRIDQAIQTFDELSDKLSGKPPAYYVPTRQTATVLIHDRAAVAPGLTLVGGIGPDSHHMAKLVDIDGRVVHEWRIDWFKMWPNPVHLPPEKTPKAYPGSSLHGAALTRQGDLIFNFSDLGMVRLDFCGNVKWRLARMTHHVVFLDEKDHIWTLDVVEREKLDPEFPNIFPPYRDVSVLEISPDGKVLRSFDVMRLLKSNGLQGFLYMAPLTNESTAVRGDALHTNDVDVFPSTMAPGKFAPGDVMVSVRNANMVFVFDPETRKIKAVVAGRFVRQHDADFVDGWTIRIFDNNNVGEPPGRESSKIIEYSFKTDAVRTLFEGNARHPFFSNVMGKHEKLSNGNILATEATKGRAIEIDPKGRVVWEYFNHVGEGLLGEMPSVRRIPPEVMSPEKVEQLKAACAANAEAASGSHTP